VVVPKNKKKGLIQTGYDKIKVIMGKIPG